MDINYIVRRPPTAGQPELVGVIADHVGHILG